jgi:hypothetical protein
MIEYWALAFVLQNPDRANLAGKRKIGELSRSLAVGMSIGSAPEILRYFLSDSRHGRLPVYIPAPAPSLAACSPKPATLDWNALRKT